jgi:transcriptional regulator with XRE-family HTH domain
MEEAESKRIRAERIRSCRKKQGLSQAQLALKLGVQTNTVWRWEKQMAVPSLQSLNALAAALSTSVGYLMGETEDPKRHSLPTLLTPDEEQTGNAPDHETLLARAAALRPSASNFLHGDGESASLSAHKEAVRVNAPEPKPPSLEDFARAREASRNAAALGDRDLNAVEEMLKASLESVQKEREERALRAAEQDGLAM